MGLGVGSGSSKELHGSLEAKHSLEITVKLNDNYSRHEIVWSFFVGGELCAGAQGSISTLKNLFLHDNLQPGW